MPTDVYVGRSRSVVLLIAFSLVTLNIYWFYWFYRINGELGAHLQGGTRPGGRLLLFLLVPVIGWFLATWLTARTVRSIQIRVGADRPVHAIYPSLFAALMPVFGWWVAAGFLQGGANRAWDHARHGLDASTALHTRLECPDCGTDFRALSNPILPVPFACPQCARTGTL